MNTTLNEILSYQKNQEDDYYFILGCDETSSPEQITAEYKSRVLSCHPDKNQDDEKAHEKFSRLSQAKDILLDPEKRRDYDRWRHSGIAITFEKWQSMTHVKTSMHWGCRKEQAAIDNQEKTQAEAECRSVSPSHSAMTDRSMLDLQEKLKFTPRGQTSKISPNWERDTANPLLVKFRNYEI